MLKKVFNVAVVSLSNSASNVYFWLAEAVSNDTIADAPHRYIHH
jgi:hypothetical protein